MERVSCASEVRRLRSSKAVRWLAVPATAAMIAMMMVTATAAAASAHQAPERRVCKGGPIASGAYRSLTITGVCFIPDNETVTVYGDLTVAAGASLNGVGFSGGMPDLSNFNMARIFVHGDVRVRPGAVLGLGCTPAMALDPELPFPLCSPTLNSQVVIDGDLIANRPLTMYLDGIVVHGDVVSMGGGPGTGVTRANPAFNFVVKDITVGENLVMYGWQGGWIGAVRDHVSRNVIYAKNTGNDPDANEIMTNVVGGNLACWGNTPPAQYGDAQFVPGAAPNVVGGSALGECRHLTEPF